MNGSSWLTTTLALCASLAAPCDSFAQWVQLYGGQGVSSFYAVHPTSDGGYVVAGETGLGGGFANGWVVKVGAAGAIVWQKVFGGPGDEYAFSVAETADGGYVVAGKDEPGGSDFENAVLGKLDDKGKAVWGVSLGGKNFERFYAVLPTPDNGYLTAGTTYSFGAGSSDAWLVKFDGGGHVLWQRTTGGRGWDEAVSLALAADGGYLVAGRTDSFGAGNLDAWVVKLDANGSVVWQRAYGSEGNDYARTVRSTPDGGSIVAGSTWAFGAVPTAAWVLKLDRNGNVVWQKAYRTAEGSAAESVDLTADGGYVVAGSISRSPTVDGSDAWVLRLDGAGNIVWQRTYGGTKDDHAYAVRATADGGFIVAGSTHSFGGSNAWLLKLDADGMVNACAALGTANATAVDTNARVTVGAATVLATNAVAESVEAPPLDSRAVSRTVCGAGAKPPVIEFYAAALDHYFITWMPAEIAALDAGTTIKGWTRTGHGFNTYAALQPGSSPVCRYYIPPALGDSHFFGRGTTECDATGVKNPTFVLEDADFMNMMLPVAGVCPAGTRNVYRVFSKRADANHRYMTDRAVRDEMVAKGWIAEGDGPDLVVMCAPL